jgi:hypothetical protein
MAVPTTDIAIGSNKRGSRKQREGFLREIRALPLCISHLGFNMKHWRLLPEIFWLEP